MLLKKRGKLGSSGSESKIIAISSVDGYGNSTSTETKSIGENNNAFSPTFFSITGRGFLNSQLDSSSIQKQRTPLAKLSGLENHFSIQQLAVGHLLPYLSLPEFCLLVSCSAHLLSQTQKNKHLQHWLQTQPLLSALASFGLCVTFDTKYRRGDPYLVTSSLIAHTCFGAAQFPLPQPTVAQLTGQPYKVGNNHPIQQVANCATGPLILTADGCVYDKNNLASNDEHSFTTNIRQLVSKSEWRFNTFLLDNRGCLQGLGHRFLLDETQPENTFQLDYVQIPGLEENIQQADIGIEHALAVHNDGRVFGWGSNRYGQLGLGSNINQQNKPMEVSSPVKIKSVTAGGHHSLCVGHNGKVYACGLNKDGQVGCGILDNGHQEPKVDKLVEVDGLNNIRKAIAGVNYSLCIDRNGDLYGFGSNENGQLGLKPDIKKQTTPVKIPVPGKVFDAIVVQVPDGSVSFSLIATLYKGKKLLYCTRHHSEPLLCLGELPAELFTPTPKVAPQSKPSCLIM